jgi:multiple antibiotic resistance protein
MISGERSRKAAPLPGPPPPRRAGRSRAPYIFPMAAIDPGEMATAFVTLLVIVEPAGLAPIFLAATAGQSASGRARTADRACLYAFAILTGAALGGAELLRLLGIGIPAFRIAGGLLLFSLAFEMVLGVRLGRDAAAARQAVVEDSAHIAAFPLAIPLMAGPGAITATLLLAGGAHGDPARLGALIAAIVVVIGVCWAVCRLATRVERLVGVAASVVMEKLVGVLLASLAVQFVMDGARSFFA